MFVPHVPESVADGKRSGGGFGPVCIHPGVHPCVGSA